VNRRYQTNAETPNQKMFWNLVKEINGDKRTDDKFVIKDHTGIRIEDPDVTCEIAADYFDSKVKGLIDKTGLSPVVIPVSTPVQAYPTITEKMVEDIIKGVKKKKSYGVDEIPMNVVADTGPFLYTAYTKLFNNIIRTNIPDLWKMALIKPLHKSGPLDEMQNYRPISNLCSLEKIFEKLILKEIETSGISDGIHQHGYKANRSTTTAMLTLQDYIAEHMDQGESVAVYSLDLSAAFDMLRVDIFHDKIGNRLEPWLQKVIIDFLSERRCIVSVEQSNSSI